jgi:hypothetical protein
LNPGKLRCLIEKILSIWPCHGLQVMYLHVSKVGRWLARDRIQSEHRVVFLLEKNAFICNVSWLAKI